MYNQFAYQQKLCIQKGSHAKASLTPLLCVFIELYVPRQENELSCICVVWYRFCLFLRFVSIRFCNYSDSVVFCVFHFIIIWSYRTKYLKTYDDISVQSDTFPNVCQMLSMSLDCPFLINVREYRRGNNKWTIQRDLQHRVHNTMKTKTKAQHKCCRHGMARIMFIP